MFISMCAIDLIFSSEWSRSFQDTFQCTSSADIWYTFTGERLKIKTCLKDWFKNQKFLPKKESFVTRHKKFFDCPEKKLAGRNFCRMTTKLFLGLLKTIWKVVMFLFFLILCLKNFFRLFGNHCTTFETKSHPVLTEIWLTLTFRMWIF